MSHTDAFAPRLEDVGEAVPGMELTAVLRELMPELLRYFARRVSDPEEASDCLGETMLVMWRRRASLPHEREAVRRYSFGVAINVLRRSRRNQVKQDALSDRLASQYDWTPVSSDRHEDQELWDALRTLRTADRELVLLVAWDGFGVGEAGAILGLKDEAARARYSRARAHLRGVLRPRSQNAQEGP